MNQLLIKRTIFKLSFPYSWRYGNRIHKQAFWIIHKSWSHFLFLLWLVQVTENVRQNIKVSYINLCLKLNSDLHETDLSRNFLEKKCSISIIRSRDAESFEFQNIFWHNWLDMYPNVVTAYKNTYNNSRNSCISRKILFKIRSYQSYL